MSEPPSILPEQVQSIVDQSINATLTALGIKARTISPWISQNKAFKMAGRKRVESAMNQGSILFKKLGDKKQSRVLIARRDIERLIRNPTL
jgi:hypothetical protein